MAKLAKSSITVYRSRSYSVSADGPTCTGDHRRACEKVSVNGHQRSSNPDARKQADWGRESATGLLSRVRFQKRQDGKLSDTQFGLCQVTATTKPRVTAVIVNEVEIVACPLCRRGYHFFKK